MAPLDASKRPRAAMLRQQPSRQRGRVYGGFALLSLLATAVMPADARLLPACIAGAWGLPAFGTWPRRRPDASSGCG